jgi:hypothetical protein
MTDNNTELAALAKVIAALQQVIDDMRQERDSDNRSYQHPDLPRMAEDAECVQMYLDKKGIAKTDDAGISYSLVGRIMCIERERDAAKARVAELEKEQSNPDYVVEAYDCEFCAVVSQRNQVFANALTKVKAERDAAQEQAAHWQRAANEIEQEMTAELEYLRAEVARLKSVADDTILERIATRERDALRARVKHLEAENQTLKEIGAGQIKAITMVRETEAHRNCPWDALSDERLAQIWTDACIAEDVTRLSHWRLSSGHERDALIRATRNARAIVTSKNQGPTDEIPGSPSQIPGSTDAA